MDISIWQKVKIFREVPNNKLLAKMDSGYRNGQGQIHTQWQMG